MIDLSTNLNLNPLNSEASQRTAPFKGANEGRGSTQNNSTGKSPDTFSRVLAQSSKSEPKSTKPSSTRSSVKPESKWDNGLERNPSLPKDVNVNEPRMKEAGSSEELAQPAGAQEKKQQVESAQSQAQSSEADGLTRRVVMQSFLRKMREKLNVEPERLVEAFSQLNPADLVMPPEQTVGLVIKELNLNPEQIPVAQELFEDMLRQTASSSMAEYLKSSGNDLSLELYSQKELRQKELQASIDRLNKNFFIDGRKLAAEARQNTMANAAFKKNAAKAYTQQAETGNNGEAAFFAAMPTNLSAGTQTAQSSLVSTALPGGTPAPATPFSPDFGLFNQQPKAPQADLTTVPQTSVDTTANIEALSAENAATSLEASTGSMTSASAPNVYAAPTSGLMSVLPDADWETSVSEGDYQISDFGQEMVGAEEMTSEAPIVASHTDTQSEHRDGEHNSQDPSMDYYGQAGLNKQAGEIRNNNQFTLQQQAPMTANQESENVRELINQAQFMIRKGGGEMKIQLQPEGLGEVNLKVMVKDGQVHVEMVTESNEAKKLLEKGIGELKATLATHKLNVEGIRVDVGQQLANEWSQQQNQAERQLAQNFLNDFRQQNDEWRRGFYDLAPMRQPKSQISQEADSTYAPMQAKRRGSSTRRLDLVA